jgi:hypothetical protein
MLSCSNYYLQNTQTTQVVSSVHGISGLGPCTTLTNVRSDLPRYAVPGSPEEGSRSDSDPDSPMADYSATEPPVESYIRIPRVVDVVYSGCKDTADCTNVGKTLSVCLS